MKFIEFGIGNKWLIRTEIERSDGTEFEEKGIVRPIRMQSVYFRCWVSKKVVILDFKEGFKKVKKDQRAIKIVFGIKSL